MGLWAWRFLGSSLAQLLYGNERWSYQSSLRRQQGFQRTYQAIYSCRRCSRQRKTNKRKLCFKIRYWRHLLWAIHFHNNRTTKIFQRIYGRKTWIIAYSDRSQDYRSLLRNLEKKTWDSQSKIAEKLQRLCFWPSNHEKYSLPCGLWWAYQNGSQLSADRWWLSPFAYRSDRFSSTCKSLTTQRSLITSPGEVHHGTHKWRQKIIHLLFDNI